MSEPRMSTAICHLLLAGSSAWTCRTLHNAGQIQWAYGTLGLYFAKSIVGVLRYGMPEHHQRLTEGYIKLAAWSHLLCNNLYMTDIFTYVVGPQTNASVYLGLTHLTWGFSTALFYSLERKHLGELIRVNCILFLVSGICTGYATENYWISCASLWYASLVYFMGKQVPESVPKEEVETLSLAVFEIFMASALTSTNWFEKLSHDMTNMFH